MRSGRGGLEQEHRFADIAADLDIAAGGLEQVAGERRRRGLAVGAGDRHQAGAGAGDLALKDFRIADDLDARRFRLLHRPMRLGMGERNAGAEHERGRSRRGPSGRSPRAATPRSFAFARDTSESSQATTWRRRASMPRCRRCPIAPSPNTATRLVPEASGRETSPSHRSFSVERPISASTNAMIQKRMTIVGSRQPFCSK